MRSNFWQGISALAAVIAGGGVAGAADLAVTAPFYKAPPVILSDWSGFYIGVHGGYGWGDMSFDPSSGFGPDARPKGGVFGGQAGYNWQYGSVVAGLEVDFSGADISESGVTVPGHGGVCVAPCNNPPPPPATRDVKFDGLASARARLGYSLLPNLLAYGTAGPGLGHSTVAVTQGGISDASSAVDFGWVAGGGLEYKLWEHVLVRAEYLHYDFLRDSSTNSPSTVDVVRGGLSYKF